MKKSSKIASGVILLMLALTAGAFGEGKVVKPAGFDLPNPATIVPRGLIKGGSFLPPAAPTTKKFPPVHVGVFGNGEPAVVTQQSKKVRTCVFKPKDTDGCSSTVPPGNEVI